MKRTVLVTGGARGIGKAIVEYFAENGFNIAFCYKNSEKQADDLLNKLLEKEVNAVKIKCDVSIEKEIADMFEITKKAFGFVDTVINNAGISHINLFKDETLKNFDNIVSQNLKSVFLVTKSYLPDMIERKFGRVINISSVFGEEGAGMEVLYSMTKAGVIGLTKALAKEVGPSGITVNAVAPGFIDTDMTKIYTKEERDGFILSVPAMRAGSPADVAAAALFLSKDDSSYISGHVLSVNGAYRT